MNWLRLTDTVINLDLVTHVNVCTAGRDRPMLQVCYADVDGFTNVEDPADVKKLSAALGIDALTGEPS